MKNFLAVLTLIAFLALEITQCGGGKQPQPQQQAKWGTGDYGKAEVELHLDMDAVHQAFQTASGPEDFENKVNQIYTGPEILSIFVENAGPNKQAVTLYIDNNPQDGKMEPDEKIVTFERTSYDPNTRQVQYATTGYGPYAYYSTPHPVLYTVVGVVATYWLFSRVFYPHPFYYTPVARYTTITQTRTVYRQSPAYQQQAARTQAASRNFNSNPKTTQFRQAGSWSGGTRSATSSGTSGTPSRSFGSSSSTSPATSSASSSPSRSFGSSSSTSPATSSASSSPSRSFGSSSSTSPATSSTSSSPSKSFSSSSSTSSSSSSRSFGSSRSGGRRR